MPRHRIELVCPGLVTPSNNTLINETKWKKGPRRKEYLWAIKSAQLVAKRAGVRVWPPLGAFVDMTIISYRPRKIDHNNLAGGAKQLIDAVVSNEIITDDSPKYCRNHYEQHTDRANPRTIVVIEWDEP